MQTGVIFQFPTEYGEGVHVDTCRGAVEIYQWDSTVAPADQRGFILIPADVWPEFAAAVTALLARRDDAIAAEVQDDVQR